MEISQLYGRQVTDRQLTPDDIIQLNLTGENALLKSGTTVFCQRCSGRTPLAQAMLPNGDYYCRNCIQFGRLTSQSKLYRIKEPNRFEIPTEILTWKGLLSPFQAKCAQQLIEKVAQHQNHLVWAVTGAGKTEMLFPMLTESIRRGKRIAIASPRIDVCNELFPRIQAAFANIDCLLLHGQANQYFYSQLTVCTTHQLMKFYHAFDILIIDEVDSFPYVNNVSLAAGAKNACKENGVMLYLTATPDENSLKMIRKRQLTLDYLPLRFHQHHLPEIKFMVERQMRRQVDQQNLSFKLRKIILKWVAQQTPFLIFVPRVKLLMPLYEAVQKIVPSTVTGNTVHANDPQRLEKVQRLRDGEYRYLVTTTILERGVTFKNLDLMVWDANDSNFSRSSLVQIAGRVGRSRERPTGDVYFIIGHYSLKIQQAAGQIKKLNRKAAELLHES